MNRLIDLFGSVSRLSATLSGGRAPVYWRRDLSSRSRPFSEVRRACAWVEEVSRMRLHLCEQPLLGHCLTAITERRAPPPPPAEPLSQSVPGRPPEPRSNRPRKRISAEFGNRAASSAGSSAQRKLELSLEQPSVASAETVFGLRAHAEISQLSRLAGESTAGPAVSNSTQQLGGPSATPNPALRATPGRHWLIAAEQRLRKVLRQSSFDVSQKSPRVSGDEPESQVETPPVSRLSMLLEGPVASVHLLTQLASQRRTRDDRLREPNEKPPARRNADIGSAQLEAGAIAQEHQTLSTSVTPGSQQPIAKAQTNAKLERDIPHKPGSTYERSNLPASDRRQSLGRGHAGAPQPSAQHAIQSAVEQESASPQLPHIAPPVLTPGLPALQSPAAPGLPTMPLAAATARISAKQSEEAARAEDLSLLAEQINRILNEEARRHGIDV